MRLTEVYEVYHSFRHLVLGTVTNEITVNDLPEPKREEWMSSFRDQVDTDNLSLTGHSFGGGTMVCSSKYLTSLAKLLD